jgi:hypothetical protein
MTTRDRIVLMAVVAMAMLGAAWLLAVSPERKQAAKLEADVTAANAQLASAKDQASSASAARARYSSAYASVVSLGKAVPADQEVPSLVYQLAQASDKKHVEFSSIVSGSAGVAGSTSAPSASSTAATTAAGFTQMPFTFVFEGSFTDLYHMFNELNAFTVRTTSGGLRVSGRLLTIGGVKLAPVSGGSEQGSSTASQTLTGTITATAYVLPAGQSATGGATSASPAGGPSSPASSASPSSAATSSPSAPAAVVSVSR